MADGGEIEERIVLGSGSAATLPFRTEQKRKSSKTDQEGHLLRKRQRVSPTLEAGDSDDDPSSANDTGPSPFVRKLKLQSSLAKTVPVSVRHIPQIRPPAPTYPASIFKQPGRSTPSRGCEDDAVHNLHVIYPPLTSADQDEFVAFTLDHFEIYRSAGGRHPSTLVSLHELNTFLGDETYCFDGFLGYRDERYWLEGIRFKTLALSGYGTSDFDFDNICIQSSFNKDTRIWYQLSRPASRYKSYHEPFQWLAVFTKHFEDFLGQHRSVCLDDFESRFFRWLEGKYGGSATFQNWHSKFNNRNPEDFRRIITAHYLFLWNECNSVSETTHKHPLWKEVDPQQLNAVQEQALVQTKTLVTPFIYRAFQGMYFGDFIKVAPFASQVLRSIHDRAEKLGLLTTPQTSDASTEKHWQPAINVKSGDVVVLDRDVDGVWQNTSHVWYAYVQNVSCDSKGIYFQLIWLYRPSETMIDTAYYPFANELFMSDHCDCENTWHARVRPSDVRAVLPVHLFATQPERITPAFIRQCYITPDEDSGKDAAFITLRQEHLTCIHKRAAKTQHDSPSKPHPLRSTVLFKGRSPYELLQPAVIMEHLSADEVVIEKMVRRNTHDTQARPNELLRSYERTVIRLDNIVRKCYVRRFRSTDVRSGATIAPYSYDGAGDCWCLTGVLGTSNTITELDLIDKVWFDEGFTPTVDLETCLNGLSLFSGGGSFDRGLEEGGAIRTRWAVEIEKGPLHTYRANMPDAGTQLWLGSVNDIFAKASTNSTSPKVPAVGQVDFISAGSPCKGFSKATQDRNSDKSLGYASLVASVLAFINLYLPEYAVLENVFEMAGRLGKNKSENVFSQVVACLVGMGYQCRTVLADAWVYGSNQSRSRLLVTIAAPGLQPAEAPSATHLHTERTRNRATGRTKSGIRYGMRNDEPCPFKHVSAAEANKDLPYIGRGLIRTNIAYPDHRTTSREIYEKAITPQYIPRWPRAMCWVKASQSSKMPQSLANYYSTRSAEWHSPASKAFKRIDPTHLTPTIRTSVNADDSRMGEFLHWDEARTITIQEARRAQGIPDWEVLVGTPNQQWLVVGNGVDRRVSVAMGLSIRRAWCSETSQSHIRARGGSPAAAARIAPNDDAARSDEANGSRAHPIELDGSDDARPSVEVGPAERTGNAVSHQIKLMSDHSSSDARQVSDEDDDDKDGDETANYRYTPLETSVESNGDLEVDHDRAHHHTQCQQASLNQATKLAIFNASNADANDSDELA